MKSSRIVLLGPQGDEPTLAAVVRDLRLPGPVATIRAGWQEWESDDAALQSQLEGAALPLELYARAERVWSADPELRVAHREMQADLRILRNLYNRQLEPAAEAWMALLDADGPERLLDPEREAALEAIQRIDGRHLRTIQDVQGDFQARMRPLERPAVARERTEIARELGRAAVVVVEGGHAAVLYNRMALFGLPDLLAGKTVIGCSAGAMVLCRRVVLYNDAPAIGRGHAEVGLGGFGLAPGLVALPDAGRRLRLGDRARLRRLALRLAPDQCALLDPGARLDWDGVSWSGSRSRRVEVDGTVTPWGHAA
jgi:Peptidase family S51